MKRLIALACACAAVPTWAADVGLGVSAKSNDTTIYVPIDIDEKLRVEPFFSYSKHSDDTPSGGRLRNENLAIGTGLFALQPLSESIRVYYGGRISYLELGTESFVPDPYFIPYEDDRKGYSVAPTFGFEYLFNEHLSIGGEAEWFYRKTEAHGQDSTSTGTNTRLILRLRF